MYGDATLVNCGFFTQGIDTNKYDEVHSSWCQTIDPRVDMLVQRILFSRDVNNLTGVLVTGVSGSGKTHFVQCVSKKIVHQYACIMADCADLVMKEVGASEKKMFTLFEQAKLQEPSVIVLENLDILFADHEYQNAAIVKLKSSLLECIDSIDVNEKVTVLATATESQAFDRSLLRKGRLDFVISLQLPELIDIANLLQQFALSYSTTDGIENSCWIDKLARKFYSKQYGTVIHHLKQAVVKVNMNLLGENPTGLKTTLGSIIKELETMDID